jgi:hypothetical protein
MSSPFIITILKWWNTCKDLALSILVSVSIFLSVLPSWKIETKMAMWEYIVIQKNMFLLYITKRVHVVKMSFCGLQNKGSHRKSPRIITQIFLSYCPFWFFILFSSEVHKKCTTHRYSSWIIALCKFSCIFFYRSWLKKYQKGQVKILQIDSSTVGKEQ